MSFNPSFDIEVRRDHINRGMPGVEDSCPIALSADETFRNVFPDMFLDKVLVSIDYIDIYAHHRNGDGDEMFRYINCEDVRGWISTFDAGYTTEVIGVKPVEISLIDEVADIKENF